MPRRETFLKDRASHTSKTSSYCHTHNTSSLYTHSYLLLPSLTSHPLLFFFSPDIPSSTPISLLSISTLLVGRHINTSRYLGKVRQVSHSAPCCEVLISAESKAKDMEVRARAKRTSAAALLFLPHSYTLHTFFSCLFTIP